MPLVTYGLRRGYVANLDVTVDRRLGELVPTANLVQIVGGLNLLLLGAPLLAPNEVVAYTVGVCAVDTVANAQSVLLVSGTTVGAVVTLSCATTIAYSEVPSPLQ